MSQQDYTKRDVKPKANPWVPVFGFISALVFGGFAWVLAPQVRPFIEGRGLRFPSDWPEWGNNLAIAFVLFIVLFALGMMIVAIVAGVPTNPRDVRTSAKEMRKQIKQRQRGRGPRY